MNGIDREIVVGQQAEGKSDVSVGGQRIQYPPPARPMAKFLWTDIFLDTRFDIIALLIISRTDGLNRHFVQFVAGGKSIL
jgi:hypothetical protein